MRVSNLWLNLPRAEQKKTKALILQVITMWQINIFIGSDPATSVLFPKYTIFIRKHKYTTAWYDIKINDITIMMIFSSLPNTKTVQIIEILPLGRQGPI